MALKAKIALINSVQNSQTCHIASQAPLGPRRLNFLRTGCKTYSTTTKKPFLSYRRRPFSTSNQVYSHPRLMLSEEQEMECPNIPTMFHLGRAIKTVNLLRNLDKYGRPLGVAVSEDVIGTEEMLETVDAIPPTELGDILAAEPGTKFSPSVIKTPMVEEIEETKEIQTYPLPTTNVPGLFHNQAWRHWYNYLDQNIWKNPPSILDLLAEYDKQKIESKKLPSEREVFLSAMRGALTQAIQHFPSVLSGSIPLDRLSGSGLMNSASSSKSWLRIGQSYWDIGCLNEQMVTDMMAMRSDEELHFEESNLDRPSSTELGESNSKKESNSRIFPGEDFRWIHFSPEDPRLNYLAVPPPLALIYQQLEQHLLLTPNFTLVPHQLEVYKEGTETLLRHDPLDPHYLGSVIIALPTPNTKGGALKLINLNHVAHEGSDEIEEEDLSHIDSDLSRAIASLDKVAVPKDGSLGGKLSEAQDEERDIDRLESDLSVPNEPREASKSTHHRHSIGSNTSNSEAASATQKEKPKKSDSKNHTSEACGGSSVYQNWSSFTWRPFGGEHTLVHPALVRTGRGVKKVGTLEQKCEPSGISWIAFTKNIPHAIEKLESGSRVLMTYHIIGKTNAHAEAQQPTVADIQASLAEVVPKIESNLNIPLVNALFSPVMRQAGIAKFVSMAAYYLNHAQPGHWLSHGNDDLTTLGIALRDAYPPEMLAAEQLTGADAWLYKILKWATSPSSGIFDHPVRLVLAPIAMIHQSQLHQPTSHHELMKSGEKATVSIKGKNAHPAHDKHTSSSSKHTGKHVRDATGTGSDRWESQDHELPNSLVYFLNLEAWEHEGPSFSQQAYANCARFSALPARSLSDMERNLYGSITNPSNTDTQWNSVPLLYGQRWGEELDTWEPAPMIDTQESRKNPEAFRVIGRKTYATSALFLQRIHQEDSKL